MLVLIVNLLAAPSIGLSSVWALLVYALIGGSVIIIGLGAGIHRGRRRRSAELPRTLCPATRLPLACLVAVAQVERVVSSRKPLPHTTPCSTIDPYRTA